ncbi:MAG: hypothetical protein M1163_00240 [Candidatus Thermoplasmatota archaeon]|nr:hypothetical protein [Candidatus Thermoplasmatota archaeon]
MSARISWALDPMLSSVLSEQVSLALRRVLSVQFWLSSLLAPVQTFS